MELKTKYNHDQKVFIVEEFIIKEGKIQSINIDWSFLHSPRIMYQLQREQDIQTNGYLFFNRKFYDEKMIFSSKKDLFEWLDKNTYNRETIKDFK